MYRRTAFSICLLLSSLPVFALPTTSQSGTKEDVVLIGVSGPFSGGSAPMGESMRNGIRLATREINRVGGINGKRIELIERDDQANNETGAKIARELVQLKVAATIGIVNTGVGMASIDTYQQAKIPLMVAVSTGPALTRKFAHPAADENYIFRVAPTLDMEAKVLVAHLKRANIGVIAIMADSTAYGDAGLKALKAECEAQQIRVDYEGRFNIGEQDMSPQIRQGKSSAAKALVAWGIGPELAVLAKGKQQLGWKVPLMGSWTISMRTFIDGAAKTGEGALTTQTFIQDFGSIGKNAFLYSYKQAYNTDFIASPMSAAQGYDGMHLLANAMRLAGSLDGSKIKNALENLTVRHEGAITNYFRPFSSRDHDAMTQNMILLGKISEGRVVFASARDEKRSALGLRKEKTEQKVE